MQSCRRLPALERDVLVPALVVGSLVISIVASAAVGVERPYPGVALGSGLLLILERAAAIWAFVLLALVIIDQARQGRLPDEISGNGVRYAPQEQFDEVAGKAAEAGGAIADRLDDLEAVVAEFESRLDVSGPHP